MTAYLILLREWAPQSFLGISRVIALFPTKVHNQASRKLQIILSQIQESRHQIVALQADRNSWIQINVHTAAAVIANLNADSEYPDTRRSRAPRQTVRGHTA